MNDDLNISFPQGDPPDPTAIAKIGAQLAASSELIRPLPSNAVLWTISLSLFASVSVLIAWVVKFKGVAVLSGGEMILYYGAVLVFAGLFARGLIERMIPGEKRLLRSSVLWMATLSVLGVLMTGLFSDRSMAHFVSSGIPCLRLGVVSALISGLLGWRLLQRGYLVSPRETIVLYGFFAGLVGVGVLALHCPIRNSLHCVVWHLGAMVVAGLVGLLLGRFLENRCYAD
jgi:hypothetical protein